MSFGAIFIVYCLWFISGNSLCCTTNHKYSRRTFFAVGNSQHKVRGMGGQ